MDGTAAQIGGLSVGNAVIGESSTPLLFSSQSIIFEPPLLQLPSHRYHELTTELLMVQLIAPVASTLRQHQQPH